MKKYRGSGINAITKYFMNQDEFDDKTNLLANDDLTPGDEIWIEDVSGEKMVSAHVYTARCWAHYLNFNV